MKQNTGKLTAFIISFLVTIMLAILVSFVLTSLYRMENTITANGYTLLDVEKNPENKVKIVALNKKYIFDFDKMSEIIAASSTYDVLIPSEVRTFLCTVKSSVDIVGAWVEDLLD